MSILETVKTNCYENTNSYGVKETYKHVNTFEIGNVLGLDEYILQSVRQAGIRKNVALRQGFQKHYSRFRSPKALSLKDTAYPEIIVINNHEAKGSLELLVGVFRLVCTNGLVAGNKFSSIKLRHTGNILEKLAESLPLIAKQAQSLQDKINEFQGIILTPDQIKAFADEALKLRMSHVVAESPRIVTQSRNLLDVKRDADLNPDLWSVLNVVQENLMRRSVQYQTETVVNNVLQVRNNSSRTIKDNSQLGIDLNRELFDLASQFAA